MNLLVIGGTRFLGPHVVRAALAAGHEVTIFNRGSRRLPEMHGLRQVCGERRSGLRALDGDTFDAVIDTCAYYPADVETSVAALATRCPLYCLISTVSVYTAEAGDIDETAAIAGTPDPVPQVVTADDYGALKAACERAAAERFGGDLLVVRPGLIAGPGDATHRVGYWVRRAARGGDVLVPEPKNAPVEFIDVRDLATWLLLAVERGLSGTFNADGPSRPTTMAEFLDACVAAAGSDVRLHWTDPRRLVEAGVEPWVELPLWIPAAGERFLTFDSSKARRAGLLCRAVSDTIAAIRAWDSRHGPAEDAVRTLSAAKEAAILSGLGVVVT